jgi:hypothetical protein
LAAVVVVLRVVAPDEMSGTPSVSTAATRQIDLTFLNSRARFTGNPLRDRLLQRVGIVADIL